MRVLAIYAHPDDAEFACSGTIAKLVSEGHEAHYLCLTGGERGVRRGTPVQKRALREREQRAAAKLLGVKRVYFLREKDCELENTKKMRDKVAGIIRRVRPSVILAFDPANAAFDSVYRFHSDHRASALLAFDAAYPRAGTASFGGRPHKVREFWFFGSGRPNKRVDISRFIDRKVTALLCHKSQLGGHWNPAAAKKHVLQRARKGSKYVEEFRIVEWPEGS